MTEKARAKLLMVDDNAINIRILTNLLQDKYDTFSAQNGITALKIVAEELPDLILLDIHMPGMNGFELFSLLKKDKSTKGIPIIFLTGETASTAKIKGLELGAVDYITKPFNRQELLARVHNQIEFITVSKSLLAANLKLRRQQALLDSDLYAAAEIQKTLLPHDLPDIPTLHLSWTFQPCERIGGDIFNVIRLDENHVGIYIIDVCGHGVPAAMITSLVFQYLSPSGGKVKQMTPAAPFYRLSSPVEIIKRIDTEFPFERFNRYFTMVYALLNFRTGCFSYCCAGHPPIIKLSAINDVELLGKGGAFIGMCDMGPQVEEGQGKLLPGERLFFYTDGILEHENRQGEPYGQERFIEVLQKTMATPLQQAVDTVDQQIWKFGNRATLNDDFSLLGVELSL